jgi:hypothetical protein
MQAKLILMQKLQGQLINSFPNLAHSNPPMIPKTLICAH